MATVTARHAHTKHRRNHLFHRKPRRRVLMAELAETRANEAALQRALAAAAPALASYGDKAAA
jgi:hypothetical protein